MRTEGAADYRCPCKNQTEERQRAVRGEITNQPSDRIDEDEDRRNSRRLADSGPLKKEQRRGEKYSPTGSRQAREEPDDSTQSDRGRWRGRLDLWRIAPAKEQAHRGEKQNQPDQDS